jgi:L-methionine (R)-S-oxide reductase
MEMHCTFVSFEPIFIVMDKVKKSKRYERIFHQLRDGLLLNCEDPESRMATIVALLHHKFEYFFWTGFYFLVDDRLLVRSYQGPVACMELAKDKGVCWAGINQGATIVVDDVEQFPDHIACSSLSKSEIVLPLRDSSGKLIGVLDVDSKDHNSFDEVDAEWLEKILVLIYR